MRGEIALSLCRAEALLAEAEQRGSGNALTVAYSALGHSHFIAGRFAAAEAALNESLRHFDPNEGERRHVVAAQATLISTQCYVGWVQLMTGRIGAATATIARTVAAAERSGVPFARANARYAECRLAHETGATTEAIAGLRALVGFCDEHAVPWIEMAARSLLGLLLGRGGAIAEGLAEIRAGLAWKRDQEALGFVPNDLAAEAELLAAGGDAVMAEARMAEAFDLMARNGSYWEQAPMLLQRASILARAGRTVEAAAECAAAQAASEAEGARLFALRAALAEDCLRPVSGILRAACESLAGESAPVLAAARARL